MSKLLGLVLLRWLIVNTLLLIDCAVWHAAGVEWVVTVCVFLFWTVQIIHVVYFAMLLYIISKKVESQDGDKTS